MNRSSVAVNYLIYSPAALIFLNASRGYKYASTCNTLNFSMHEEKQEGKERIK